MLEMREKKEWKECTQQTYSQKEREDYFSIEEGEGTVRRRKGGERKIEPIQIRKESSDGLTGDVECLGGDTTTEGTVGELNSNR